ncbi:MAG: accessory factor UbiK family protein [Sphingorhabdus sp.]
MQSENRIFDDIAKMLNGMAGTMAGMGREAQESMRERVKEFSGGLDFVSREEFDAVKQMASKARAEADALASRVEKLEAAAGGKTKRPAAKRTAKTTAKRAPAKKAAAKKMSARKAAVKKPAARKKPARKKPARKK